MLRDPEDPLLSIVTVVKDDEQGLQSTQDSIRLQDARGFEWIVVDSSSQPAFKPTGRYFWTEPAGIYPAMNFGLAMARGTYVYFLNAGDTFARADSLRRVLSQLESREPAWLVAQVEFEDPRTGIRLPAEFDFEEERSHLFARGRFPPHQGTIVRRDILADAGGFDESFRVCADYHLALRLSQRFPPVTTDVILARFHVGGTSQHDWRRSVLEFHRARIRVYQPSGLGRIHEWRLTVKHFSMLGAGQVLSRLRGVWS